MKEEHREMLDKMRDFFINWDAIPDDEFYQKRLEFDSRLDILAATKDTEILEHLLDFFDENFDCEVDEACEILKSTIGSNFTLDQLIEAFYKKFDQFAEKYLGKCIEMSMYCVRNDCRDKFRQMFNTVRSKHSKEIVENLKESALEFDWEEDSKQMIYTLEEDMKSW
jgi:hypothetical protein